MSQCRERMPIFFFYKFFLFFFFKENFFLRRFFLSIARLSLLSSFCLFLSRFFHEDNKTRNSLSFFPHFPTISFPFRAAAFITLPQTREFFFLSKNLNSEAIFFLGYFVDSFNPRRLDGVSPPPDPAHLHLPRPPCFVSRSGAVKQSKDAENHFTPNQNSTIFSSFKPLSVDFVDLFFLL